MQGSTVGNEIYQVENQEELSTKAPACMSVKLIWLNKFNANGVVLFGMYEYTHAHTHTHTHTHL